MPEKTQSQPSPEPQEFPHFFTEVVFQLIPEVNYDNLVRLSQLLKINKGVESYQLLVYALRKIQWAKLSGQEAIEVENEIAEQQEGGGVSFNPVGQTQHAKSIFEFVMHTKSALDLLAVFLAGLLSLEAQGDERDFKHKAFRSLIIDKDAEVGQYIKSLETWFLDIQERKDKWFYRSSTRVFLPSEPIEIGLLPVAKVVTEDYTLQDLPPTRKYYWATEEFMDLNFNKLASFFNLMVERCIEMELAKIETPPAPPAAGTPMSAFPLRVIQDTK